MKKNKIEVKQIPFSLAKPWILEMHYLHRLPSIKYAFGLFVDGCLVGVCTYGVPASPSLCAGVLGKKFRKNILELNRLVINSNSPKNSASMLIGRSLRQLPDDVYCVVSYADTGWGHIGYVYQATNWLYTGLTKERTDIFVGDNKHSRHYDKNNVDYSKRKFRSAKHRYVFFTKSGKKYRKFLRYEVKPYPKGDSKRYDCKDIKNLLNIVEVKNEFYNN